MTLRNAFVKYENIILMKPSLIAAAGLFLASSVGLQRQ